MDGTETELKLAVEAALLPRVVRVAAIDEHRSGRASALMLRSTYFDTPDQLLAQAGVTVRLRRQGRAWTQTVKTAGERASGLFQRREWEVPVATAQLDVAHLLSTGLAVLQAAGLTERLTPVFSTEVKRTLYCLTTPEWDVDLALDQGTITAGGVSQPIAEVEMELGRGAPEVLFHLGREIAAALPCRLLALSKSDRGFMLAAGRESQPVKAQPLALDGGMRVIEAFQAIARNCLAHLLINEACLRGPHAMESVHQMRVALRRLRSAIKVFKPLLQGSELDDLREEMRWLLAHLGPARDGDVFLAEIIAPVVRRHAEAPALAHLHAEWIARRDRDFSQAVTAVDDRRFTLLLLRLGQWIATGPWAESGMRDAPVPDFARRVLKRQHRRLMRAGGGRLSRLAADDLHQVRILGKQMRYAGEFFSSLYPRSATKPFLAMLAELQEALGALNDLAVAGPKLASCHHQGDWAWAAGLVCGWHESRRPGLMADAEAAWKRLRKTDPFWE